jgi:hypothetical protein
MGRDQVVRAIPILRCLVRHAMNERVVRQTHRWLITTSGLPSRLLLDSAARLWMVRRPGRRFDLTTSGAAKESTQSPLAPTAMSGGAPRAATSSNFKAMLLVVLDLVIPLGDDVVPVWSPSHQPFARGHDGSNLEGQALTRMQHGGQWRLTRHQGHFVDRL